MEDVLTHRQSMTRLARYTFLLTVLISAAPVVSAQRSADLAITNRHW